MSAVAVGAVGAVVGLALTPVPLAVGHRLRRGTGKPAVAPASVRVFVMVVLMAVAGAAVVSSTAGVGVAATTVAALAALVAASAAAVDLLELRLPNVLTYTLAAGGAVVAVIGSITGRIDHPWFALLAGAGYGLVMLMLALVSPRGGYGLGDVKLATGLGIWVGLDYPATVAGALLYGQLLILATLLTSYVATRRRAGPPATEAPLGPALLTGAALAVLLTG